MDHVEHYREWGYAIVRGVFDAAEVMELASEIDVMKAEGQKHHSTFRHQNILYVMQTDPVMGHTLRFMQWPSYISPVLEKYRVDRRLLSIVSPLIGKNLKQIVNQIIWKPVGANQSSYAYHQDHRFRRPASSYRDLAASYVQTAIAIDPHTPENGCLTMFRGSHKLGDLQLELGRSVYEGECDPGVVLQAGLDERDLVEIRLDPGDVALWSPYMVHGSGANRSRIDRRSYLNGYVIAENSDRGEWAFRNGEPCQLGEPVLVQYEDLFSRPEPHYVKGSPHPFRK